jgi:hypothetical protein
VVLLVEVALVVGVVVVGTSVRLENRLVVVVAVALVCRKSRRVEDRWEVVVVAFEVVLLLVEGTVVVGVAVDNFGRRNHRLCSHRCSPRRHRVVSAWILVEMEDLEMDRTGLVTFPPALDIVDTAQDAPC